MQQVLMLVTVALVAGAGLAAAGDVHPIEKVIGLLEELSKKVQEEGKTEAAAYADFEKWCAESISTVSSAVADEKTKIDELESTVESKKREQASLEDQIKELTEQIAKHTESGEEAEAARKEAAELYKKADEDFAATIEAIGKAIKALEATQGSKAAALLATLAAHPFLAAHAPAAAVALGAVARGRAPDDEMAKKVTFDKVPLEKYTYKSGNVIELLQQLETKFKDDRLEATKEETNQANSFALAKDARASALEAAETAKSGKETALGECKTALEEAEGTLKDTREDLEADTATLEKTQQGCSMKKSEWAERSATREHELEAMAAAVKILAKVGKVRTEVPENIVPPPSPLADGGAKEPTGEPALAFLQLDGAGDPRLRAVNLLRQTAEQMKSRELEKFAQKVAAHLGGPFDDINNMIQKLIFRLMADQKDEDDHKMWCDLELDKTNTSKVNKEDKIDAFGADIEEDEAAMQKLVEEIDAAQSMIADIDASMKEATAIRQKGAAENKAAIEDAAAAQAALEKAVSVLTAFYKESGEIPKEPWEFVQVSGPAELPESPSTWEASYTGVSDPAAQPKGIISMLQAVADDFSKMEADTRAQEVMDKKAFDEESQACKIEKARRTKEAEMKEQESKRIADDVAAMKKSRKHVSAELDAVKSYLKDLQPACVTGDSTYEQRKSDRATEIEALKKAQVTLQSAFQEEEAESKPAADSFLARGPRRA